METRILAKGQVTNLTGKSFSLGGTPFSIFLRRKAGVVENDTLVKCRLICDDSFGYLPVVIGDWTPAMIVSIAPAGIDLAKYEVYWGASEQPSKIS